MADRPILFSAPMVRALLDGRKTQTRRLLRNPEYYGCPTGDCPHNSQAECNAAMAGLSAKEANGYAPSDRLWVREHWKSTPAYDDLAPSEMGGDEPLRYLADDATFNWGEADGSAVGRHRQAMHMPRWASRLTLAVTEVRVQRLQECSEEDARAEGVEMVALRNYRDGYAVLWNSLHTAPGTRWDDNPWIVAVTFDVRRGNIDQVPA